MSRQSKEIAAVPPAQAVEAMRRHREREHDRSFDLSRHVSYPGRERTRAPMTYVPQTGEQSARFHCKLCPGYVGLIGGVDYSDPEAQAQWISRHPREAKAIRRLSEEQRPRAIAAFESGDLVVRAFDEWLRKDAKRTVKSGTPRPAALRRQRCQEWMLEHRAEGFKVDELIDALEAMQIEDPSAWRELTRSVRTVGEAALRGYWMRIPIAERHAAWASWLARPEAERRRVEARRRTAKLHP